MWIRDSLRLSGPPILILAPRGRDADVIARVSEGIGEAMKGLDIRKLPEAELLQTRGW